MVWIPDRLGSKPTSCLFSDLLESSHDVSCLGGYEDAKFILCEYWLLISHLTFVNCVAYKHVISKMCGLFDSSLSTNTGKTHRHYIFIVWVTIVSISFVIYLSYRCCAPCCSDADVYVLGGIFNPNSAARYSRWQTSRKEVWVGKFDFTEMLVQHSCFTFDSDFHTLYARISGDLMFVQPNFS